MSWVELSEGVNLDYLQERKVGEVLGFTTRGKVKHYRIVRIDKKRNKYWATPTKLLTPEQAEAEAERRRLK